MTKYIFVLGGVISGLGKGVTSASICSILMDLGFRVNIKKPKFIEIGVGNYYESNTRFLFERSSCKGLVMDIIKDFEKEVGKNVNHLH